MDEAELLSQYLGTKVELGEVIQSLWSGYGSIRRVRLDGKPAILKLIDVSRPRENLRGWGSEVSHERKLKSYQVERHFYEQFSKQCGSECRVPKLLSSVDLQESQQIVLVMEDLDATGYPIRKSNVDAKDFGACLRWLAEFHALFLGTEPKGLWDTGTYWHLATRPEELKAMPDGMLKRNAILIDRRLESAKYKTLVHGDAKLANFCFGETGTVAAVDFQYVGSGCGMKDVAYFISSCFDEHEAESREEEVLNRYFSLLAESIERQNKVVDVGELIHEWRELFVFAWADFVRFLAGWSPGHWKLNAYSQLLAEQAIRQL
ncbi:MAG: phosphotransferase [Planctomycetota bacterium]